MAIVQQAKETMMTTVATFDRTEESLQHPMSGNSQVKQVLGGKHCEVRLMLGISRQLKVEKIHYD